MPDPSSTAIDVIGRRPRLRWPMQRSLVFAESEAGASRRACQPGRDGPRNPAACRRSREQGREAIIACAPSRSSPSRGLAGCFARRSGAAASILRHSSHPAPPWTTDVFVGPGAVIEANAAIGARTSIDAGVIIGAECAHRQRLPPLSARGALSRHGAGNRVIVHAGAVLGSDGFGYVRDNATGEYTKFPQQGRLIIEDDVEIGANTTIDRGALEETRIGRGTKLDNLVHVGHNVTIGRNVVIAAQTGVSGSSTIGDGAIVGGQVGIADHVEIGPGAILGAQAGIPSGKRIHGPGIVFWGTPARPIKDYLKELATLARLTRRPK